MSFLAELDALFGFLTGKARPALLVILELEPNDFGGDVIVVHPHRLKTPSQFTERFHEIVESGYSWVNLSYRGQLGDKSIVTVELPNAPVGAKTINVNYSGPSKAVIARGGLASEEFCILTK